MEREEGGAECCWVATPQHMKQPCITAEGFQEDPGTGYWIPASFQPSAVILRCGLHMRAQGVASVHTPGACKPLGLYKQRAKVGVRFGIQKLRWQDTFLLGPWDFGDLGLKQGGCSLEPPSCRNPTYPQTSPNCPLFEKKIVYSTTSWSMCCPARILEPRRAGEDRRGRIFPHQGCAD